jgi:signal transduction histidine kinase
MTSFDTSQPAAEDLKLLVETSQLLTSLDLDTVMRRVIDLTSRAVGADKVSLFLHGRGQLDWEHIFLMRTLDRDETIRALRVVMEEGLAGWVTRHRKAALVYDTADDPRWHNFPEEHDPPRSALCVPLIHDGEVLAVLTLAQREPGHFTTHHLEMVQIIANQAAVAIRNAQLYRQAAAQQRQLEAILSALPEFLLVLDRDGKIVLISDGVEALFGGQTPIPRAAVIGQPLSCFTGPEQPAAMLTPAVQMLSQPPAAPEPWTFEARDEAHGRDYQVSMGTWTNPDQQPGGYILLLHDVTTLRDLHRFKDEMLKIVSHDLRNPLALIMSAATMLETDLPPLEADADIQQYIHIIHIATRRMEALLEDLLRADSSKMKTIDPVALTQEVIERVRPLAERKQHTLEVFFDVTGEGRLVADQTLIGEAMENYLSNAIKYTPRQGHIVVRAYYEAKRFYFTVEDNGVGIASEHLPHLFKPYYRPPGNVEQGYGIGLNLVKTIVERHGGQVWVNSVENQGSLFGFWIPLVS